MILLGLDIGSSFVKGALIDSQSGMSIARSSAPTEEMRISAPQVGFAEQDPEIWWRCVIDVVADLLRSSGCRPADIQSIGLSYQMHGLVLVDRAGNPLRPALIWCDSRAVNSGQQLAERVGVDRALNHLLNTPGNFTASKLAWVAQNEPEVAARAYRLLLPGDYIAYKLSGDFTTTIPGLSEGTLYDFKAAAPANWLLDELGLSADLVPDIVDTFSVQGQLSPTAAGELSLPAGISISYRAGDQPNNALALNVVRPGEVAATAGTSGVVYLVTAEPILDRTGNVNTFAHVNYSADDPHFGALLCISGTGIMNSWLKKLCSGHGSTLDYVQLNDEALQTPPGSDGLLVFPYGNGAERTLGNRCPGASFHRIDLNRHSRGHLARAIQEGISCALLHGLNSLPETGTELSVTRAAHANMFLSPVFCEAFVNLTGRSLELYHTDGAEGAARGAGVGAGIYSSLNEALESLRCIKRIDPDTELMKRYSDVYQSWLKQLVVQMKY